MFSLKYTVQINNFPPHLDHLNCHFIMKLSVMSKWIKMTPDRTNRVNSEGEKNRNDMTRCLDRSLKRREEGGENWNDLTAISIWTPIYFLLSSYNELRITAWCSQTVNAAPRLMHNAAQEGFMPSSSSFAFQCITLHCSALDPVGSK